MTGSMMDSLSIGLLLKRNGVYLMADGRYDFIETGSLISIRENVESITIPSEERKMKMYPVDFEEFMIYMNEEILLDYIKECYKNKQPLDQKMHQKAMHLFKEYMLKKGTFWDYIGMISGRQQGVIIQRCLHYLKIYRHICQHTKKR